jgi:hypothetical protein
MFLAPVPVAVDDKWVCLFYRFCVDRHEMYKRREAGVGRENLSAYPAMQHIHLGNVFRQLDPSSKKMQAEIMGIGNPSHTEVCCEYEPRELE